MKLSFKHFLRALFSAALVVAVMLIERVSGLPILATTIFLFLISAYQPQTQWWASLGGGLLLSVIYVLPLWGGVALWAGASYFYQLSQGAIDSSRRRIVILTFLVNIILWWQLALPVSTMMVIYHLLSFASVIISLYLITGRQPNSLAWNTSKRLFKS